MPSHELEPVGRHRGEPLSLDLIKTTTNDREVLGLWEAGLARHEYAFVAFAELKLPELYTAECLFAFRDMYMGSVVDRDSLFEDHLEGMGWVEPVRKVRDDHVIPDHFLVWDKAAVMETYEEVMYVVEAGGMVHVFGPK